MNIWLTSIALGSAALLLGLSSAAPSRPARQDTFFKVYPIGYVHKSGGKTYLEIEEKYAEGLLGLDGFSHVHVIWWFHKNDTPQKRRILQVHPRHDPRNPLTGVFATRAPVRPNLIALTTCKIVSIEGRRVYLDDIDAFDGTPVLDLKPYIPGLDRVARPRLPAWVRRK